MGRRQGSVRILRADRSDSSNDKTLVHRSRLLEFREEGGRMIKEQAVQKGLGELFEEVLVPTEEVIEVRRGRKIKSERRFFPGYVLVKMELTDEAFHLIKNTPKVTGFLGSTTSRCRSPTPKPTASSTRWPKASSVRSPPITLRNRRAGARGRWSVRFLQRPGGGSGRRPRRGSRWRCRSSAGQRRSNSNTAGRKDPLSSSSR